VVSPLLAGHLKLEVVRTRQAKWIRQGSTPQRSSDGLFHQALHLGRGQRHLRSPAERLRRDEKYRFRGVAVCIFNYVLIASNKQYRYAKLAGECGIKIPL
jgi:hypothetical protein